MNFCQKSNQNQYMRKKDDFGLTFCQYVPYKILSWDLNSFNVQRTPDCPSPTFGLQRLWSSSAGPQLLTFIQTSDEGIISYQNNLKTKFIESGSVFPILPNFDVPLQCDLHTSYDFVFTGDWHPDVSSFKAELSTHFDLEGTMTLFHDGNYTEGMCFIQKWSIF